MTRRSRQQPTDNLNRIQPAAKKSTGDLVFESLREAILSHELPGGTPLIEAQLAEQFQVSKTPIREALQRLTHAGLADFELARGATVHTLTLDEIRDIFELRILLEPVALRQSGPQLSTADIREIENTLKRSRKAIEDEDLRQLSLCNNLFHESLYSRAHNALLLTWLQSLNDRRRMLSIQGWALENRSLREWEEHKGILEAVKSGEIEGACALLAEHIERFSTIILKIYPEAG